MAGIGTSAGTTLGIVAGQPTTFDAAGYGALTFGLIGNIDNLGSLGRTYNITEFNPIASRGTQKFKSSFNEGDMTVTLAYDSSDVGTTTCKTALDDDADYSFEITFPDGGYLWFQAKVSTFVYEVSGVDDMRMATLTLAITTTNAGVGIVEGIAT
jgi:hypothetical protein